MALHEKNFTCPDCGRRYKYWVTFKDHRCSKKIRVDGEMKRQ